MNLQFSAARRRAPLGRRNREEEGERQREREGRGGSLSGAEVASTRPPDHRISRAQRRAPTVRAHLWWSEILSTRNYYSQVVSGNRSMDAAARQAAIMLGPCPAAPAAGRASERALQKWYLIRARKIPIEIIVKCCEIIVCHSNNIDINDFVIADDFWF